MSISAPDLALTADVSAAHAAPEQPLSSPPSLERASLMITYPQSFLSAVQILDGTALAQMALSSKDLHELGHSSSNIEGLLAYFYRWHVRFLANLADKLRNVAWARSSSGAASSVCRSASTWSRRAATLRKPS